MTTTFSPADVSAYEHATWSRCAPGYAEGFALLTRTAVSPLLDAVQVRAGHRILDIGTGTGTVAAEAQARGIEVVGVDFSDAMLAEARRALPAVELRCAAADRLPYSDESFDAVVANGVLHHLGDPVAALREARRVLRAGGRYAATVWAAPESLEAFGLFFAALAEHAGDAELPHGPLFGVADAPTLTSLLTSVGFGEVTVEQVGATWAMSDIDVLLRAFATWAQLDAFPAAIRAAVENTVREAARRYRTPAGVEVPNPMVLVAGSRSS